MPVRIMGNGGVNDRVYIDGERYRDNEIYFTSYKSHVHLTDVPFFSKDQTDVVNAVVLDDKIYALLSDSSEEVTCVEFDGEKWNGIRFGTLPGNPHTKFNALAFNGKIHLIGSIFHFALSVSDGTVKKMNMPFLSGVKTSTVLNGYIYAMSTTKLYRFGSAGVWEEYADVHMYNDISNCILFGYNDQLHLLNGDNKSHVVFDGEKWTSLPNTPFNASWCGATEYENAIWIAAGKKIYRYDANSWNEICSLNEDAKYASMVVFEGDIAVVGGYTNKQSFYLPYKTIYMIKKQTIIPDDNVLDTFLLDEGVFA